MFLLAKVDRLIQNNEETKKIISSLGIDRKVFVNLQKEFTYV
jgi:DNA-directed RNA polymerase subunit N (RpoN/RPB10)